jgi:cellulose synthase/poly-beta-1,6-N-acetylglucosamine synthase-like glycosyltransferase
MIDDALLKSRFTDVEWEGLFVSCAIWLCTIRADTRVGKGVLVQMSAQITKSSSTRMGASRKIMQAAKF